MKILDAKWVSYSPLTNQVLIVFSWLCLQTRQTPSTNYTEHIRLPYFASEHTMHRWTHTYIASRRNTQQSVSTAPTVMRPLNISCSTAHCMTTSDPDYCQLNQIYTTRYMDPLHNCNEQPPTTCQPWTDVTRLSEVWGTKKGKGKKLIVCCD